MYCFGPQSAHCGRQHSLAINYSLSQFLRVVKTIGLAGHDAELTAQDSCNTHMIGA